MFLDRCLFWLLDKALGKMGYMGGHLYHQGRLHAIHLLFCLQAGENIRSPLIRAAEHICVVLMFIPT